MDRSFVFVSVFRWRGWVAVLALILCASGALSAQDDASEDLSLEELQQKLAEASKGRDELTLATALGGVGAHMVDLGNFPQGLEYLNRAMDLFEKLGRKNDVGSCMVSIIQAHYTMHNTEKMEAYGRKLLKLAEETHNNSHKATALNVLAIACEVRDELDKAIEYYNLMTPLCDSMPAEKAYLLNNLADCYRLKHDYNKAITLLSEAITAAQESGDSSILATAMMNEVLTLTALGRHAEAKNKLEVADRLFRDFEVHDVPRDLFLTRAVAASAAGNYREAYEAHVKYYQLDSALTSETKSLQFAQLETAYQTQKKEEENERLNARLRMQWLIIGGSAALLLLLGGIVFLQRNRMKIKTQLHEAEQQLAASELQKAKTELEHHKSELSCFTQSLREKTETLERLKAEAENRHQAHHVSDLIEQLQQATILTDEQWRNFRMKFERVHGDFFNRFQQAIPDATEAEKRLAALSKLDLSGNAIAAMLGISPDSVIKTRYRLRKKVADGDLEKLLQSI